ncbi:RusA family crossover junction endodeoxyribonuclease [Streptomyces misionensis]|uniref:RusA family crossover junction endodeoxyribonuclease n=1 Tax=Streptomyces misionensis TaxID=67331 RepID=UPI0033B7E3B1
MSVAAVERPGDRERAERIGGFLAPGRTDELWGTVYPGEPHSKARPRFDKKGRAYKDPADKDAEETTKWWLRQRWRKAPLTGNVSLGCVFFRSSMQLIDGDNLLKHVADAGNSILWVDDSQVTAKYVEVQLDHEYPRTVLVVGPHFSTMRRGTDNRRTCPGCATEFVPSRGAQVYCTTDCHKANRRKAVRS